MFGTLLPSSLPSSSERPETGLCEENFVLVLLSAWNGEKHISEQLESIRRQQGKYRVKLLIRDDGSTDGTVQLLQAFCAKQDERVTGVGTDTKTESDIGSDSDPDAGHASALTQPEVHFSPSFMEGPNKGFIGSFFELLRISESKAAWYAFSDQDDVWQPDKLDRAVSMLQKAKEAHGEIPLLYASRLELVDGELHPIGYTRRANREPSFENALVENIATGATMVMNKAARDLICEGLDRLADMKSGKKSDSKTDMKSDKKSDSKTDIKSDKKGESKSDTKSDKKGASKSDTKSESAESRKDILLHDWWCYLVVSAFGKVLFDPESHILYRQHGKNSVGQKVGFLDRQKRRLARFRSRGNVCGISRQAALFCELHGKALSERKRQILMRFLEKGRNGWSRLCYALWPDTVRQAWYDDLLMRILILLGKL